MAEGRRSTERAHPPAPALPAAALWCLDQVPDIALLQSGAPGQANAAAQAWLALAAEQQAPYIQLAAIAQEERQAALNEWQAVLNERRAVLERDGWLYKPGADRRLPLGTPGQ